MTDYKTSVFKPVLNYELRPLQHCRAIINQQLELTAQVKKALPAELGEHVVHCVASGQKLLVYTASACWASQIRFFQDSILTNISTSAQQNLTNLQVKLILTDTPRVKLRMPRVPSAETVSQLYFDDNGDELAQSLGRLLATLHKKLAKQV